METSNPFRSREGKRPSPPIPAWFQAQRVLSGAEVFVHCNHAQFGFHNQTVVLGRGGLLLLAPLPLREGTAVRVDVSRNGQGWEVEAAVAHALPGWGTVLRFPPSDGWGWQLLKAWLPGPSR